MSSKTRRAVSLPPPPPSPPLSTGNLSPSFDYGSASSRGESDNFRLPNEMNGHHEIVIGKDLCRAIRELQAVPSLRWPTRSLEFDDFNGFANVDDDCVFVNRVDQLSQSPTTKIDENDQLDYCNGNYSFNVASTSSVRTTSSFVHSYSERTTTNISVTRIDSRWVGYRGNEAQTSETFAENSLRSESLTSDYGSLRRMQQLQTTTGTSCNSTEDSDFRDFKVNPSADNLVEAVLVDDRVWNGIDISTAGGSHLATDRKEDGVERLTVTSGTAVTASVSEFSDDYDIYEKQMDELELLGRGATNDTDDDYETDFAIDATVDDERFTGSYTVDGRVTSTSSILGSGAGSCSNFSSGGVDASITETDWTSPPDSIHLSDVVDWEEIVSEKEKYVRSVLMSRKQMQQTEEEKVGGDERRPEHSVDSTFQSAELDESRCIHRDTNIAITETERDLCADVGRRRGSGNIDLETNGVSETLVSNIVDVEEVGTAAVIEQRSTITKTTLVNLEHEHTTEMDVSTNVRCNVSRQPHDDEEDVSTSVAPTTAPSVRYQLNFKPEKVKAISLESFITQSSSAPRITRELPVTSATVEGLTLNASPVAEMQSPSVENKATITFDGIDAIDFTAEELFEEIMESLSDATVPDVDDNDDDFIDRSIKFWFSSPVIVSSGIDGRLSISPRPSEIQDDQPTSSLKGNSQSAEQLQLTSTDMDSGNLNKTNDDGGVDGNACRFSPNEVDSDQQVPVCDNRFHDVIHTINNTTSWHVITHDVITEPTRRKAEAGATDAVQPPSGTECSESSNESTVVAVVEGSAIEDTTERASVKSLRTYFERQSFVEISSSPAKVTAKVTHTVRTDVVDESDDSDLDSVVRANVCAAHGSLNNDIDGCLDGLVDLNRRVIGVASSKRNQTEDSVGLTPTIMQRRNDNTVSTSVLLSSSRWQHSYDSGNNVDGPEDADADPPYEKVTSIRLESALPPGSDVETRTVAEEESATLDLSGGDSTTDDAIECRKETDGGPKDKLPGSPSSDATHSDVMNDDELQRIHGNATSMPSTDAAIEHGAITILSDELTTQEIVLTVRHPRGHHLSKLARSQRHNTGAGVVDDDRSLAVQFNGAAKVPFRHLSVRRVVRVIDEEDSSPTDADVSGSNRLQSRHCEPLHGNTRRPTAHRVEIQTFPVTTTTPATSSSSASHDDVVPVLVRDIGTNQRVPSAQPINVEFDRKARSSAIEYVTTDGVATNEVSVLREDAVRVVRLPGGHTDHVRLPAVTPINETIDSIALALRRATLSTSGDKPEGALLPVDMRVTCEAFERRETLMTSSGETTQPPAVGELIKTGAEFSSDNNTTVTVVRRTLLPVEMNAALSVRDDVTSQFTTDSMTSNCAPTVTSFP